MISHEKASLVLAQGVGDRASHTVPVNFFGRVRGISSKIDSFIIPPSLCYDSRPIECGHLECDMAPVFFPQCSRVDTVTGREPVTSDNACMELR